MTFASPLLLALSLATSPAMEGDVTNAASPARQTRSVKVARVTPRCGLRQPGSDGAPSETCLACHGAASGVPAGCDHPVQLRYQRAKGYATRRLRSESEVERRGVVLLDGRVECISCHDGRSPWADHLVLLPGATAQEPSLPPGTPRGASARAGRIAIDTTALCSACHDVSG